MPDDEIARRADADGWFVVTKDDDFRIAHLLSRPPARLFHVTCGNISTPGLLAMFEEHWSDLMSAVGECSYAEIDRSGVVIHDAG